MLPGAGDEGDCEAEGEDLLCLAGEIAGLYRALNQVAAARPLWRAASGCLDSGGGVRDGVRRIAARVIG